MHEKRVGALIRSALVAALLPLSAIAAEGYEGANSVQKQEYLRTLRTQRRAVVPRDLLAQALTERSAVVVAEAVKTIGALKIESFTDDLVALYDEAGRFGGYAERVQFAVLGALASCRNERSEALLLAVLDARMGSSYALHALQSLAHYRSAPVLGAIDIHRERIAGHIAALEGRGTPAFLLGTVRAEAALAADIHGRMRAEVQR